MAARSGLWGPCPISPAAKPANPAPSAKTSSRWLAGTSFAFGFPYISTNCAKTNSIPILSTSFRTSSTDRGAASAIVPPLPCGVPHPSELDHFGRDREREPVVVLEIDTGDGTDPSQPLPERVRVDEQCARRAHHVAPTIEIALERVQQAGAATIVVRHQRSELISISVSHPILRGQHILVRSEIVVRRHTRNTTDQPPDLCGR